MALVGLNSRPGVARHCHEVTPRKIPGLTQHSLQFRQRLWDQGEHKYSAQVKQAMPEDSPCTFDIDWVWCSQAFLVLVIFSVGRYTFESKNIEINYLGCLKW